MSQVAYNSIVHIKLEVLYPVYLNPETDVSWCFEQSIGDVLMDLVLPLRKENELKYNCEL